MALLTLSSNKRDVEGEQTRCVGAPLQRRGFVHVLLLVFVILGIGMWGVSELHQRSIEQKKTAERQSDGSLEAAKRALLDYAIILPRLIDLHSQPGHFNAYSERLGTQIPFRRFSLPCPDVSEAAGRVADSNLDGVSDILETPCAVGGSFDVLKGGSGFGRLPWRHFDASEAVTSEPYLFVRGVGGRDFRDSSGQRFWYIVSQNVGHVAEPLNPHALLRQTDGWLTAVDGGGNLLSDRVAAFVIAPGLYGQGNTATRLDEEAIYTSGSVAGTDRSITGVLSDIDGNNFHQAYLEPGSYAEVINGRVTINTTSDAPSADQIEYLTIDDLAAANGAGINLLEESGRQNIYDIADGDDEFLGVTDLLEEHLNRFGFLPEPAVFDDNVVTVANRPSGVPTQTDVAPDTVPFQQGAQVAGGVSVALRVVDLPLVYLSDNISALGVDEVEAPDVASPYNIGLANLETALNVSLLSAARVAALEADEHYPEDGLFGLNGLIYTQDDSNVRITIRAEAPTPITVTGLGVSVILADDAYGYFQATVLNGLVSYVGGGADAAAAVGRLPPSAVKALLPAGTPIALLGEDADGNSNGIVLNLPAGYEFVGTFNTATERWELSRSSDDAVQVTAPEFAIVTVGVPSGLPVVAGDIGFLPIESVPELLTIVNDTDTILLPNGAQNAISDLAVDVAVYLTTALTIVPFPPPGRPTPGGNSQPLPTPLFVPDDAEFIVPVGSRLIYPLGSEINIGEDFAIPDETLVEFPSGAELTLRLTVNTVLPGGVALNNSAEETMRVTLLYGGLMRMRGARPILDGPNVIAARQSLFDIEIRGVATLRADGGRMSDLPAGQVVQPFTGRMTPSGEVIDLQTGDTLVANSRVRAKFLVRPRRAIVPLAGSTAATAVVTPLVVEVNDVRTLQLPNVTTQVVGAAVTMALDEDTEFTLPADWRLPIVVNRAFPVEAGVVTTVMENINLPADTSIFDPDNVAELFDIRLADGSSPNLVISGGPLLVPLVSPIQVNGDVVGLTENRLALFPDSDMYVLRGAERILVPAGSVVDLMAAQVHLPTGVQRTRRVADDLQIRSEGVVHMYFNEGVALLPDVDHPRLMAQQANVGQTVRTGPSRANLTVRFSRYDAMTRAAINDSLVVTRSMAIPAGSYITIPAGRSIDFLSPNVALPGADLDRVDYAHLPSEAVLVLLPGQGLTIDGVANRIIGPAYVALGDQTRSMALVNRPTHLSGEPLIFLSAPTYLRDDQSEGDLAEKLYASIPGRARLDIYGNMEKRSDSGFYGHLMPTDSSQFFTDFPMVYAVAPECRQDISSGADCGEGENEGLQVELQDGSEYILEEEIIAGGGVLLTSNNGVNLAVEASRLGADAIFVNFEVESMLVDEETGMVSFPPPAPGYVQMPNDRLVVRVAADPSLRDGELRAYMGATTFDADDLAGLHYAAVDDALTVHVGGYLGRASGNEQGVITLPAGSQITLGAGARLLGGESGEKVFGADSSAAIVRGANTFTVDLSDYVVVTASLFNLSLTLSAESAHVGLYDQVLEPVNTAVNISNYAVARDTLGTALTVVDGASIPMQPGYLWQGYLPVDEGEGAVTVVLSQNADIFNTYTSPRTTPLRMHQWPAAAAYLRVPSEVTLLNTWGSGLERPEGMDAESTAANTLSAAGFPMSVRVFQPVDAGGILRGPNIYGVFSSTDNTALGPYHHIPSIESYSHAYGALPNYDAALAIDPSDPSLPITVVVHDLADGSRATTEAQWRPVAVNISNTAVKYNGLFRWNRKSHPFSVPPRFVAGEGVANAYSADSSRAGTFMFGDLNLPRNINPVDTDRDTDATDIRAAAFSGVWGGSGITVANQAVEDSGYIDDLTCGGQAVTVAFNPPNFMMAPDHHSDRDLEDGTTVRVAWNHWNDNNNANMATTRTLSTLAIFGGTGGLDRPVYVTLSGQPGHYADANARISINAAVPTANVLSFFTPTNSETLTSHTDMAFYLDRAYNPHSGVPQQNLSFGDAFHISGPGALVPPFGGKTTPAVAGLYAERSAMMNQIFRYPALHPLYDDATGGEPALFSNPDWFPIVGGVVAFESIKMSVETATDAHPTRQVRLILPQPSATVPVVGEGDTEIYAGSIIYPRQRLIYPSSRLPEGEWELRITDSAQAAVDVSPAIAPRPKRLFRSGDGNVPAGHFVNSGHFNYAPIRVTVGTPPVTCVIEPLHFAREDIINLNPLEENDGDTATGNFGADFIVFQNTGSGLRVQTPRAPTVPSTHVSNFPFRDIVRNFILEYQGDGVDEVFRYDNTFSRGVLANDDGARIANTYLAGENIYALSSDAATPLFTAKLDDMAVPIKRYDRFGPMTDLSMIFTVTVVLPGSRSVESVLSSSPSSPLPANPVPEVQPIPADFSSLLSNTDVELGNPSAFRWQNEGSHFLRLGIAREHPAVTTPLALDGRSIGQFSLGCGAAALPGNGLFPNDYCSLSPHIDVGVNITTTADEFRHLRLAHRIDIPATVLSITVVHGGHSPDAPGEFRFPDNSIAHVLNNDYSSWLSAHPYMALYQQGLEFRSAANTVTVAAGNNAGYARYDVGGRRVLHYRRAESLPADEPFSAAPVYTNVWLRLDNGGVLHKTDNTEDDIVLPPGTMFNPIMGTYLLSQNPEGLGAPKRVASLTNNYLTEATVVETDFHVVRPALTIPAGARLVAGDAGGLIRNVKALAIFSLTPLDSVACPSGPLNVVGGQSERVTGINQTTEGLADNRYRDETGPVPAQSIGFGHPCMWVDDPENTDGDRLFLYRGRRRYQNEGIRATALSNDRTYLVGGKLELRF